MMSSNIINSFIFLNKTHSCLLLFIFFLNSQMKNSLELEITTLIKKANSLCAKDKYPESLCLLDEALVVFTENKNYNHSVNPLLQGLLFSLKGQINFKLQSIEKAEENFQQSLQINPFDALTLIRRGTLYCQTNRLPEALEDLQRALICDPRRQSLKDLTDSIERSLQKLDNADQRIRLTQNLVSTMAFLSTQEEDEENQEEKILSFSNLKKIDRHSISNISNKLSQFQSQYSGEKVEQISDKFASDEVENWRDQNDDHPVEIIQKRKVNKKPSPLSFNNLRLISGTQLNQKKKLMSCQQSYKSIEGKLQRRISVKFIDSVNIMPCSLNECEKEISQKGQNPVKRKSCLRASMLKENGESLLLPRRASSFMEIKNIDGSMIPSVFSNTNQATSSKKGNETNYQNNKEFSDSDEETGGEHNIFGQKSRTSKILQCIENLNNWSGKKLQNKHEKKRSILKKNSLVGSEHQAPEVSRSSEHKKSVCFQGYDSLQNK